MKDYGITYSAERPEEVDVKSTKVFVATDIKEEKDGGYSYDLTEYDKDEYEAGKKSAPAVRSGEQYFTTLNGYYCKDAAGRALLAELEDIVHPDLVTLNAVQNGVYVPTTSYGYGTVNVNVPFYPREDTPLELLTSVETMDMHTEPTIGTRYYPIVYLAAIHYPAATGEEYVNVGKYFAPTDANYSVTTYIDIIDKETGESVEGFPQRTNTGASFGINSGGYIRLKGWYVTVSNNHVKVNVVTTRWNTTYSKPLDDTYATQTDLETWLSAYTTPPYVIYGNDTRVERTFKDMDGGFEMENWSTMREATNGVAALRITAGQDGIPQGAKIGLEPALDPYVYYTFTEAVPAGRDVIWENSTITKYLAQIQCYICLYSSGSQGWNNSGVTIHFMSEQSAVIE